MDINSVRLNFNKDSVIIVNLLVGIIMFGVSLDLKKDDFLLLWRNPKSAFVGLVSQYILLPLATLLIIVIFNPHPGLAIGMILVAACPGGNMSNFFTNLGKGNLALSVSLTTFSSSLAFILTPLVFFFWGNLLPETSTFLKEISVDSKEMFLSITIMLLFPLILGLVIQFYFPRFTARIRKPIQIISVILLAVFIFGALAGNWNYFLSYIHLLFGLVFIMNLLGLAIGYYFAKLFNLKVADRRTISIETGIQNSSLGLAIVFNFFDGMGGMALICAWWGIWHLLSGATVAFYWSRNSKQ
ncbi:MAG: bile acid:sodium symporter family protein [Leptospira sp.]|nr:bile acid:sodium symporter family protein [Leptospira sp.]